MSKKEQDFSSFENINYDELENEESERQSEKPPYVNTSKNLRPRKEFVLENYDDQYNNEDLPEVGKRKKKKRKRKKSVLRRIITILLILGISTGLAFAILNSASDFMGINKEDVYITIRIPEGSGTGDIAKILKENGIIKYELVFQLGMRMQKADGTFKYGIFTLNPSMTYTDIKEALQKAAADNQILFVEGNNVEQYANKLESEGICSKSDFLDIIDNPPDILRDFNFMQYINESDSIYHTLEGYAFPDTYDFNKNTPAIQVVADMLSNFNSKLTDEHYARMQELDMTFNEIITLASIIEKEASVGNSSDVIEQNMRNVSAVFYNRLQNAETYPYLETDPTRDYVNNYVTSTYEEGSEEYEKYANAYSTFRTEEKERRVGLPEGPICNPSLMAIEAALYPNMDEMQNKYFFVTDHYNPEQIYYAETNEEHEANKQWANTFK